MHYIDLHIYLLSCNRIRIMLSQRTSLLFKSLEVRLTPEERDEMVFLIGDHLEHFGICENLSTRQLLEELLKVFDNRQLMHLLDLVFAEMPRNDLRNFIKSQLSERGDGALEEPCNQIGVADDISAEISGLSSLCEEPAPAAITTNLESVNITSLSDTDFSETEMRNLTNSGQLDEAHQEDIIALQVSDTDTRTSSSTEKDTTDIASTSRSNLTDSGIFSRSQPNMESASISDVHSSVPQPSILTEGQLFEDVIEMRPEEMQKYKCDENVSQFKTGGFGRVYRGIYKNINVAIKEQMFLGTERQFHKEKDLAFLRNTYIVPTLAYSSYPNSLLMIMYVYMDNGDLSTAHTKLETWEQRTRVLYHCSEGLAFLHRPVDGVRNEIVHGDIKPGNILLDAFLNARLGDVGVAAEIPSDATHCTTTGFFTDGYEDPHIDRKDGKVLRKKHNDLFSLGVVGLQLLKWTETVQHKKDEKTGRSRKVYLHDLVFDDMSDAMKRLAKGDEFVDRRIWNENQINDSNLEEIERHILYCLETPESRLDAEQLATNLKAVLTGCHVKLFASPGDTRHDNEFCKYCCINKPDPSPAFVPCSDTCSESCTAKRFCRICHGNAYRNPLYCPEHGRLRQLIRPEDAYAILISGYGNDEEEQKTLNRDVKLISNIITDPRIMGLRQKNVAEIISDSDKLAAIKGALNQLKQKRISLLIVYYSGHGVKNPDKPKLMISERGDKDMRDSELQKELELIKCTQLLVIFDCCYASRYKVLPKHNSAQECHSGWKIMLAAAESNKTTTMKKTSKFTHHLSRALEKEHDCPVNSSDNTLPCSVCETFKRLKDARGYVDLYDVMSFCSKHIQLEERRHDDDDNDDDDDDDDDEEEESDPVMIAGELRGCAPIALVRNPLSSNVFSFHNQGESIPIILETLEDTEDEILKQLEDKIKKQVPLPERIDYRCLKIVGLDVKLREIELCSRADLVKKFSRGCKLKIHICCSGKDLEKKRNVVFFCSQDTKIKSVINEIQKVYGEWFLDVPTDQSEHSYAIRCSLASEIHECQFNYSDEEKKIFLSVLKDSLCIADQLSQKSGLSITGLNIAVTSECTFLSLREINQGHTA